MRWAFLFLAMPFLLMTNGHAYAQKCYDPESALGQYVTGMDAVVIDVRTTGTGINESINPLLYEELTKAFSAIPQIRVLDRAEKNKLSKTQWAQPNALYLRVRLVARTEKSFLGNTIVASLSVSLDKNASRNEITENALANDAYPFVVPNNTKELEQIITNEFLKRIDILVTTMNCANHFNDKLCKTNCQQCATDGGPGQPRPQKSKTPEEVLERLQQMRKD